MFDAQGSDTALRRVLDLEIFARAEAFIAAGEDELDRPVRWVHAAEIADIAQFLSGGELLLTAGHGIGQTAQEQRAYIRSIAEVGVAALAVELTGRVFSTFPQAVVTEAGKRGVPLIGLRHEVPFVEASAQVLEQLTADNLRESARTVEMNRQLTERLMAGSDHISLVRCISEDLGHPVVLESADHEVQAYFGEDRVSQQLLNDWGTHSRSMAIHSSTSGSREQCLRIQVQVQGASWGWLHTPVTAATTRTDRVLLEQGASAISISLLNERVSGARSRHQQGILINRLMLDDVSGKGFVDRALRLGKDLRKSRLVVVIVGSVNPEPDDLEREVSADLRGTRLAAVSADLGDAVLSVVALRGERSLSSLSKALCTDNRFVGFSKVIAAEDLPSAIKQAKAAFFARQPCQFFDRLGVLRLLVPLSSGPELAGYVEDELGELLTYDNKHDSSLFSTLVTFLECEGNKSTAAKELFIQRRTLYYRLDKIGEILGLSLEDSEVRLRLRVAIRASELLHNARNVPGLQR